MSCWRRAVRGAELHLPAGTARERKAYALADHGRRVLKAEIARMQEELRVLRAIAAAP